MKSAVVYMCERIAALWVRVARWAQIQPPQSACPAVDVIGFLESASGLGSAARGLVEAIAAWAPREISISRVSPSNRVSNPLNPLGQSETRELPHGKYAIHLYNPDVFVSLMLCYGPSLLTRYSANLIIVNWETERLPRRWTFILGAYDRLAAPSTFTALAVQQATQRRVHVIPNYVPHMPARVRRSQRQTFVFLTMFDALSSVWRKNPRGSVLAFGVATRQVPSGVTIRLRIKCHGNTNPAIIRAITEGHESSSLEIIAETMSSGAMHALWEETDCLISLHRSEGFGLPVAEAMARGIPVITTRQGGVLDFATDDNADLVDGVKYGCVDPTRIYRECTGWMEPSVDAAAACIVRLVTDYAAGVRKAAVGRLDVQEKCGPEAVRKSISNALNADE